MTAVTQMSAASTERILLGLGVAVLGNLLFATSDALVKLLTARYTVFQIIVTHASFAMIPITLMLLRDGGVLPLRIRNPRLVFLRGLLAGSGNICGFYAFSQLPLAESYSIFFCTPLLVTIFSIPLLGEKVGLHRWGAVIVGLLGVVVMVRPGFVTLGLGHLAALAAAVTGAFTVLVMRKIAREERHGVMAFAAVAGIFAVSLPGAFLTFRWPELSDLPLFACSGLLMGMGQFLAVRSLALAPASVVAPMQYTMMLWAVIYGVVLFGTIVDPWVLLGATIVIASGLYIMRRERQHGRTLRAHTGKI